MNNFGFCDLNIQVTQPNLRETVIQALKLGYRTIALTREISDEVPCFSKKKKKDQQMEVPQPYNFSLSKAELTKYGITKEPNILSRITVIYSQPGSPFLHKAKDVLAKYDVIAFMPTTESAFKQICQSNVDVDIITLSTDDVDFRPSRKLIQLAIKRDIYFEVSYGPCISSATTRQKTIQLAHTLQQVSRSINVIITSRARRPEELRNPYDVANLGLLFGLTQGAAKAALMWVVWGLLYCARKRRVGESKCSAKVDFLGPPDGKKTKYESLLEIDKLINKT